MLLRVERLAVAHGDVTALWDVSFCAEAGALIALVGPNGAGKTSLMTAVAGLIAPRSGRILLDGADVTALSAEDRAALGVALCPEGRRLFADMSVEDNLLVGAHLAPSRAARRIRLDRVFAMFPRLAERRRQTARTLSGGEQQMAAIGRALMAEPRLLLLDEPSLGLAPVIVTELFAIVSRLARDGLGVVLVEQNVAQSLRIARRGYVLENGVVRLEGDGPALADDPYIRATYLGIDHEGGRLPPDPPAQ